MKINISSYDIFLSLIPIISGYIAAYLCPIRKNYNTNIKLNLEPPKYVFKIIWPILYILIGICWSWINKTSYGLENFISNLLFGILNLSLILWIFVYGCQKNTKLSLYIIIFILGMSISTTIFVSKHNKYASLLLSPFICWIFLASLLNYSIVAIT